MFACLLREFPGEDELVEEELQLLVGRVDAQLLKTVELKLLKAKNVEHRDAVSRRSHDRECEK